MLNTKALARHVSYFDIIRFKYYLVDKEISTWRALETNSTQHECASLTTLSIVSLKDHFVNAPHSY